MARDSEAPDRSLPSFTAIIPVHPDVETCAALGALAEVDYPPEKFDVLVAKGGQPSIQRNRAAEVATGDILYFLDDDSIPQPGLFRQVAPLFLDDRVAAVSGPNLAAATGSILERAVGTVLGSRFGTYRIKARYTADGEMREASETDIILCNLCMRREFFLRCGGFNELLYPNEENELFRRIRQRHPDVRILYDPDAAVFRQRPRSIRGYVRKIFNYGRGRMLQTMVRPDPRSAVFLLPSCLLLYLAALPFLVTKLGGWPLVPLGVYAALDVLAALGHGFGERSLRMVLLLAVLYPLTHLSYAAGLLFEALARMLRRRRTAPTSVEIVPWKGK